MSSLGQSLRSSRGVIFILFLGLAWSYLLFTLKVDLFEAGNAWKQGDWLINEFSEPIRRGLFGSLLLMVSDALRSSPLLFLISLQALIVTLVFIVIGLAALKLGLPDKLLLILLSPAFLILFWFNDSWGAFRKELLVYLAFLPLVLAALRGLDRPKLAYALSCIAWAIADWSY